MRKSIMTRTDLVGIRDFVNKAEELYEDQYVGWGALEKECDGAL